MVRDRPAPVLRAVVLACVLVGVVTPAVTIAFAWGWPAADELGLFGAPSAVRLSSYGAYALVGGVVASRRPGNAVGWIFMVGGTAMTVQLGLEEYAYRAIELQPGTWPAAVAVDWIAEWLWVIPMTALQFSMLLFPDGRLPSRSWRPVATALVVGDTLLLALVPVATWPLRGRLAADDALVDSPVWGVLQPVAIVMAVATVLCALSLVLRYRRATGELRLQLRWLAVAAVVFVSAAALESQLGTGYVTGTWTAGLVASLAGALGTVAVPVAAAMAILKLRLYDIDRLVSRTLAWAVVTALVVGIYLAVVVAAQSVLRPFTGSTDLGIALATLAAAAGVRPLESRVRRLVDRRFDRARYDAARTVDAFGRSLRDEVSRDVVVDALRATANRTVAPSSVGVLLMRGGAR